VEIADFEMAGSLDIDVLIQYDGLGKCSKVWCARYLDTLSNWASKVGWKKVGKYVFSRQ